MKSAAANVVVLSAYGNMQRSGDTQYPFRQNSNFWYVTGLNQPDVVLVMDKSTNSEFLIQPPRSDYEEIFITDTDAETAAKVSGVSTVLPSAEGWKRLETLVAKQKSIGIAYPPDSFLEVYSLYTNPAQLRLKKRLMAMGATEFIDVRQQLAAQRQVKQAPELSAIRKAVSITTDTLNDIYVNLGTFSNERDIDTALYAGYRSRGADGHSFDPIVASGKNACVLHYMNNNEPLGSGEFVLVDTGAEVQNYAADITRTLPVGEVSKRHKEVYAAVYEAQQIGIAAMKPGTLFKDIDNLVNEFLTEKLAELKLKPLGDNDLLRSYYPHTWHFMGLDVHDVGDYQRKLETGMVLTVEPGIYIKAEGIGVRIEDDVLITDNGYELLSSGFDASLERLF